MYVNEKMYTSAWLWHHATFQNWPKKNDRIIYCYLISFRSPSIPRCVLRLRRGGHGGDVAATVEYERWVAARGGAAWIGWEAFKTGKQESIGSIER